MRVISAIATVLIFCFGMFLKLNRAAHIIDQTSGDSAYNETSHAGFTDGFRDGFNDAFSKAYSGRSSSSTPAPAGVQTNPYVK